MFKQMAYQKILIFAALAISSIAFMYSLGYATDLYSLSYHADSSSSLLYVEGAELYNQVQPFNKTLLTYATILFGLCITLFMTLSHRRRLYYATNYLSTIGFSGYAVFLGTTLLQNATHVKQNYLAIDFQRVEEVTDMLNLRYVESTFMMDAGIVLSIAMYLLVAGLVVNLVWKTANMIKEKQLMRGAEK